MAMTGTERVRAHRERRRRSIRKLTIEVSEDDLREIAKAGYEGAAISRCQAQAVALFVSDIRLNPGRFDCGVPGSISCLGPTKVRVQTCGVG
jgi:hypothetical protein